MRSTFLRLRVHPLRFFQVSNLRLFEVKTSKNLNFRGEVEVSISEVFGRPSWKTEAKLMVAYLGSSKLS